MSNPYRPWAVPFAAARKMRTLASTLLADRAGNFAMIFALVSVPVLMALGCSFDYAQALTAHRRMQTALDAALVAAVKDVGTADDEALKSRIIVWLNAAAPADQPYDLDTNALHIDRSTSIITASVATSVPTSFLKIAGINDIPVAVKSGIAGGQTTTKSAFSMYLVLDHSGSMSENTTTTYTTTCGASQCTKTYTKIEALKLAVNNLMTQLATADPAMKYVRTGAAAYNNKMSTPSALAWGEDAVKTYVTSLKATGTTDSSDAIATAYAALTAASETQAHKDKTGIIPQKYIVFMTDGNNNVNNADTKTKATCDSARANNVRVYTIAFMAPAQGQALLKYCATTSADYFAAESTADIVNAFTQIGETSSQNVIRLTQ